MPYDKNIWNERWTNRDFSNGWTPDNWLVKHSNRFGRGEALDIACGRGRNALFLAESGYRVTAVDYSSVAMEQLDQEAGRLGLNVETRLCDLEKQPDLPPKEFDLIINFFYLHRPLFPLIKQHVKTDGLAIIRTFTTAGNGEPCSLGPDMVLEPGELRSYFSDWDILAYEEGLEPSKKGGTLAGIIARKPVSGK